VVFVISGLGGWFAERSRGLGIVAAVVTGALLVSAAVSWLIADEDQDDLRKNAGKLVMFCRLPPSKERVAKIQRFGEILSALKEAMSDPQTQPNTIYSLMFHLGSLTDGDPELQKELLEKHRDLIKRAHSITCSYAKSTTSSQAQPGVGHAKPVSGASVPVPANMSLQQASSSAAQPAIGELVDVSNPGKQLNVSLEQCDEIITSLREQVKVLNGITALAGRKLSQSDVDINLKNKMKEIFRQQLAENGLFFQIEKVTAPPEKDDDVQAAWEEYQEARAPLLALINN
jgi:hypothetical protein